LVLFLFYQMKTQRHGTKHHDQKPRRTAEAKEMAMKGLGLETTEKQGERGREKKRENFHRYFSFSSSLRRCPICTCHGRYNVQDTIGKEYHFSSTKIVIPSQKDKNIICYFSSFTHTHTIKNERVQKRLKSRNFHSSRNTHTPHAANKTKQNKNTQKKHFFVGWVFFP